MRMDDTASELGVGGGGVVVAEEGREEEEKRRRGISFTEIMISILLQRLLLFYSWLSENGAESTVPCWHTANTALPASAQKYKN